MRLTPEYRHRAGSAFLFPLYSISASPHDVKILCRSPFFILLAAFFFVVGIPNVLSIIIVLVGGRSLLSLSGLFAFMIFLKIPALIELRSIIKPKSFVVLDCLKLSSFCCGSSLVQCF